MTAPRNERDDRLRRLIARNTELEEALTDAQHVIALLTYDLEQRDARIDELERAAYGAKW
jgi:hypothetical protein